MPYFSSARMRRRRESATDLYIVIILGIFPLFFGVSGYQNITQSKYLFWMTVTGLWAIAVCLLSLLAKNTGGRPRDARLAVLAFLLVCLLSWLFSPYRKQSLLGAGRYDGLLTLVSYCAAFYGVSAFTHPKRAHILAFAAGCFLCCCIGVLQLFGLDPLGLFPAKLCFYDAGTYYSGVYLGTIGNTNILDAVLCLALPLFFSCYLCGGQADRIFLVPLPPACFLLLRAGGSAAAVALGSCGLLLPPLLVTDGTRLRRFLHGGSLLLLTAAAAFAFAPEYTNRVLDIRFRFGLAAVLSLLGAAVLLGLSFLFSGRFHPEKKLLCRILLGLDAAVLIAASLALLLRNGAGGTAGELREMLHGRPQDSFGSSRIRIWRECLALVRERPLLGGGPGTAALRLDIHFSRYVPETGKTLSSTVDNTHNIFLGYLVNCGAAGLISYLGLLLCGFRTAFRSPRRSVALPLALSIFSASVHGLFGLGLVLSEPFFWILFGLMCAENRGNEGGLSHEQDEGKRTKAEGK